MSSQVMIAHQSDSDDIMSDFCDGNYYRLHSLFNDPYPVLQICLYFDELEVCNPLRSKRTLHKLGDKFFMYYYDIPYL